MKIGNSKISLLELALLLLLIYFFSSCMLEEYAAFRKDMEQLNVPDSTYDTSVGIGDNSVGTSTEERSSD